ncbi:MAG: FadD3 family acyl-CoA ligase [Actinomycetes bacterium]
MSTSTFDLLASEDPRGDLEWTNIPRLVEWAAERFGDDEAVVDGDLRLNFVQLAQRVDEVARGLIASGFEVGDRAAMWAPNCHEWIVAALGVLRAGGVIVTLNTRFKGSEAAYIIRSSETKWLLTVSGFLGFDYPAMLVGEDLGSLESIVMLRGNPEDATAPEALSVISLADMLATSDTVDPAETARRVAAIASTSISDLIFTSGTTGRPKGAMTTHAQTLRTFATWASIVGLRRGDRYLVVNPFFHTFGYKAGLLASLMAGATVIPESVFDVDIVLGRIAEERISMLPGPPTLYQSILSHPRRSEVDLTSLRLGVTGAAVVPVELVIAMSEELGFETVLTAYGLTESCGVVTMCRRDDSPEVIATTSGRAIPNLEVRVMNASGSEVPSGEAGEIVVRGYAVMEGYFANPEETTKTIDPEGWLHTGDIGTMDRDGNICITDRLKDMFVVGGFNAYPAEIEATIRGFHGVAAVAVIGVPDERMGEVGRAYLVRSTDDPRTDEEFVEAVLAQSRDAMANYKAPRTAVVIDILPTNASGKVLKRDLRDSYAADHAN